MRARRNRWPSGVTMGMSRLRSHRYLILLLTFVCFLVVRSLNRVLVGGPLLSDILVTLSVLAMFFVVQAETMALGSAVVSSGRGHRQLGSVRPADAGGAGAGEHCHLMPSARPQSPGAASESNVIKKSSRRGECAAHGAQRRATEWQDSHSARPQDAPKGWCTGRYAMTPRYAAIGTCGRSSRNLSVKIAGNRHWFLPRRVGIA